MDKRFEMIPIIYMSDWESMVMEEAGYGKYVDDYGNFDWDPFHEEKGIEQYFDKQYIENVLVTEDDGKFAWIDTRDYLPKGYNEEKAYGKKVGDIRAEIKAAAIRLFEKGIAPKEFVIFYRY